MINRDVKEFQVGDYVGHSSPEGSRTWRVDAVTDTEYVLTSAFTGVTETVPKNCSLDDRPCLLRPNGHPDITNFPIGSEWIYNKDHSFIDKGSRVLITAYGWDEGDFAVCDAKTKDYPYVYITKDEYTTKEAILPLEKTKEDSRTAKEILDDMPSLKDDYEIEVVVRITKRELEGLKAKDKLGTSLGYYERAIVAGAELPKEHGDLIDRDKLNVEIGGRCDNPSYVKSIVNDEQPVIPAKESQKDEVLEEDEELEIE